jgi:hypothetical protein
MARRIGPRQRPFAGFGEDREKQPLVHARQPSRAQKKQTHPHGGDASVRFLPGKLQLAPPLT